MDEVRDEFSRPKGARISKVKETFLRLETSPGIKNKSCDHSVSCQQTGASHSGLSFMVSFIHSLSTYLLSLVNLNLRQLK